jgi:hypothetical protein
MAAFRRSFRYPVVFERVEIGCDNGERARIASTSACCDREAIAWVATIGKIALILTT